MSIFSTAYKKNQALVTDTCDNQVRLVQWLEPCEWGFNSWQKLQLFYSFFYDFIAENFGQWIFSLTILDNIELLNDNILQQQVKCLLGLGVSSGDKGRGQNSLHTIVPVDTVYMLLF